MAYAALVVSLLAYFMLDVPVQLTDSYSNIIAVQRRPLGELIINNFWNAGYLRPLLFAPIGILYQLSDGNYHAWFRGFHVAQLALTVALFVGMLRVRTAVDMTAVPLALAMLVGIHTFAGTIREAFPVNTFLTVIVCALSATLIASSRWRWWSDPMAVLLLAFCVLTVESGLLVWVILVAGYMAGWRGVSRAGLTASTLAVGAYFAARFWILDVGTPSLMERSAGFGLRVYEPEELVARFGESPWPFYAYNVAASMMSVLFAEPRNGVFWVVRELIALDVEPWTIVNLVACTGLTVVIARHVWIRRERWRRWDLEHSDRLIFVFAGVLAANAAMSYSYAKDVVMSPAGVFFALAGFGAASVWLGELRLRSVHVARFAAVVLLVITTAWGIKAIGVHYSVRDIAWQVRREWAGVDQWLVEQEAVPRTSQERAIKDTLQADALWRRPARPRLKIPWPWPGEWFDTSQ